MEELPATSNQFLSKEDNHWLNGFIRQNCEEARKRVIRERTRWNHSEDDDAEVSDLTRTFKEEPRSGDKEDRLNDKEESLLQYLNSDELLQPRVALDDDISIHEDEQRLGHDDDRTELLEERTSFEFESVEVTSLGITHSKERLFCALSAFNSNVVEMERISFMQIMIQVEETVNEVLDTVERLDTNFRVRRMSPESFYHLKSRNELDIFVVLDSIFPEEFVIEDMKTPTGYARVRLKSSRATPASSREQLVDWCIQTHSGELYLSPKKICKRFAALVCQAADGISRRGLCAGRRQVTFIDDGVTVPFTTNLVPTIACPQTWPLCAHWLRSCTRKWPETGVKEDVITSGMHLAAFATGKETEPLWRISFCAARRRLLTSDFEGKRRCLRILKVLLDKDLSRPKGLVPMFLENIVLWASRKHWRGEEWAENMLPERFMEMLVALLKCLENNNCYHFFVPTMNLFGDMKPEVVQVLAAKVKRVLQDPFKYLER